ncbi:hypothetical protein H6G36_19035 [Anabaena minutissima FACHB-250]|nr:hypothetical protein [Anabaena minutissima FACHB-250]
MPNLPRYKLAGNSGIVSYSELIALNTQNSARAKRPATANSTQHSALKMFVD